MAGSLKTLVDARYPRSGLLALSDSAPLGRIEAARSFALEVCGRWEAEADWIADHFRSLEELPRDALESEAYGREIRSKASRQARQSRPVRRSHPAPAGGRDEFIPSHEEGMSRQFVGRDDYRSNLHRDSVRTEPGTPSSGKASLHPTGAEAQSASTPSRDREKIFLTEAEWREDLAALDQAFGPLRFEASSVDHTADEHSRSPRRGEEMSHDVEDQERGPHSRDGSLSPIESPRFHLASFDAGPEGDASRLEASRRAEKEWEKRGF